MLAPNPSPALTSAPSTSAGGGPPTGRMGLATEYYQLVQSAVYHADGLWGDATFDLYVKGLPDDLGYLVACGVEPAIDAVLSTRFGAEDILFLAAQPEFRRLGAHFLDSLKSFRFEGDIHALPEGTPVFPGEPILRVTGPLQQVGLFETRLLQIITLSSAVATRACRMVQAAAGKPVVDFGSRRCAGPEAAWYTARAAWIGGFAGTTNALAAASLGLPTCGVMSAAMMAAYDSPREAMEALRTYFPGHNTVNLPGPDIEAAVAELAALKEDLPTLRLDHKDLGRGARQLRQALNRAGLERTRILGSNSLNEERIAALVEDRAPVDIFGVGAAITPSAGPEPALSYRIAELVRGPDPTPVVSHWSSPWPGQKQILRHADHDELILDFELHLRPGGRPLLEPVVIGGQRRRPAPTLEEVRRSCAAQVAALPAGLRRFRQPERWPLQISEGLRVMSGR